MTRLVVLTGTEAGNEMPLRPGSNSLGRAGINDVVLADPSVSGRHCEIVLTETTARLRDLGSTNGTLVNGRPAMESELADGQIITVGSLQLRLEMPPVVIAIPTLTAPEPPRPQFLPDGTPACFHHEGVTATTRCLQCGRTFCAECLHQLRIEGGRTTRVFCPVCSGPCQPIQTAPAPRPAPKFVERLRATLRLPFRPGPPKR